MKKKLLSLILVFSLMLSFAVTSYASTDVVDYYFSYVYFDVAPSFPLEPYEIEISSSELNHDNNDLYATINFNEIGIECLVVLYDKTLDENVAEKFFFTQSGTWELLNTINPNHDYIIKIYTYSGSVLTGTLETVIK